MNISKDIQKDVLLESFDILKNNFDENYQEIGEIVGKMSAFDISVAMNMWEYILKRYPDFIINNAGYINDDKSWAITSNFLDEMKKYLPLVDISKELKSRAMIKEASFLKTAHISNSQCEIIAEFIAEEDYEQANELLNFVNLNQSNKGLGMSMTIGGIYQEIIDNLYNLINEKSVEFIYNWIQKIQDPKEKAKASVRFLNLIK